MANPREKEFAHDFFGSEDPKMNPQVCENYSTFSVGIFRWLPKASGKGLKKSAVMYRVRGYTSNPEPVYKRAEEICEELDKAFPDILMWMIYKKSETVRQDDRNNKQTTYDMKTYPCPLSPSGKCKHGGNKKYNYGFVSGTASYCRLVKEWVSDMEKCPDIKKEKTGT